ncbi:sigma-70 family RNA polymerase sigma factor [Actinomadura soli]|uniref:Sigma-70 family RNA polymerase sigma factor n=1 Tax=Actinomadura soli TaxID=2508997 RepID=A0A5C4JEJ4_9ACTN|nr:sigma-70 family RNA polymerase sigma factor [Actinomadura soli]TMR03391.1 sigma-70 family RNA polymerase sigma factor [Actinomadura soli]
MDDAFSEFFRQEHRGLIGFVMKLGARQAIAEEVTQSAFLEAYRRWDTIRHPRAWVRTVAARTYFKGLDKGMDDLARLEDSLEDTVVCDAMDIADYLAQRDRVQAALDRLPMTQRFVMAWSMDGYPASKIAVELTELRGRPVSPESVRKARQRAREALRAFLGSNRKGVE